MVNYYELLGIKPGCSPGDIKRSFRKKAKELHPDLKSFDKQHSEEQMRNLITAYEILSNPEKRTDYDHAFALNFSKINFSYRDFLRRRKNDLSSQSKLIFHDLLNANYEEAIDLYYKLKDADKNFKLGKYINHEDYMDCLFLLAEALEKKSEYIRACNIYKELVILEIERPYFHHFMDEVIERLRNITCFKMVSFLPPPIAIRYIKELIDFNFSRKDNAFLYKKISEIYCNLGNKRLAFDYLQKGLKLDQKLPGVKKLKEKIGFSEITAV